MNIRVEVPAPTKQQDLKFLPRVLVDNCRQLIESYHDIRGYGCLPDVLWRAEARDFVEVNDDLRKLFRKAPKIRGAKKANAIYLSIASALLAVEMLANDVFGWGVEFPAAKKKAASLLRDYLPASRVYLRDVYLCERNFTRPPSAALMSALTRPPVHVSPAHTGMVADLERDCAPTHIA